MKSSSQLPLPSESLPQARSLYDATAHAAASVVIKKYSTSFSLAVSLLQDPVRTFIRDLYAMVRVADEIVDGACDNIPADEVAVLLNAYEREVLAACERGFSTDPVVHSFAQMARITGVGPELITPFFASMRADLTQCDYSGDDLDTYIFGSAEVIGLMCIKCILYAEHNRDALYEYLSPGARHLGAAFQKVNFLRDVGKDAADLGRTYFEGVNPRAMTENDKRRLLIDIKKDLHASRYILSAMPPRSRVAVRSAYLLFAELAKRIAVTPAKTLMTTRIRVSNPVKMRILASALWTDRRALWARQ